MCQHTVVQKHTSIHTPLTSKPSVERIKEYEKLPDIHLGSKLPRSQSDQQQQDMLNKTSRQRPSLATHGT